MRSLVILIMLFTSCEIYAQAPFALKQLGTMGTVSASAIRSSRWSIGGETLDRNYADYQSYKSYLGPLGAKRIRFQGGWAKCETIKGRYDFVWLDSIVNDAIARGVRPWLQTSYGNPIYDGGGEAALAGGIPTSVGALVAWDNWVAAFVKHFKNRVNEWEIWNEPDLSNKFTALEYAAFYERTAMVIRTQQPAARLVGLSLCCRSWASYADTVLRFLKEKDNLKLLDIVAFHGYKYRPEDTYKNVEALRKVVLGYTPGIEFWQGENGAPSVKKGETGGAMSEYNWSELTQAKWNLRRMLGDMGYDIAVTNLFAISDMYYSSSDHIKGFNAKGLLMARPDKTIEKAKLAYHAFQHAATLFSGKIARIKNVVFSAGEDVSAYAYTKQKTAMITIWMSRIAPVEDGSETVKRNLAVNGVSFKHPVIVDLISGKVYELPPASWKTSNGTITFIDLVIPDYPVVITEKELVL